MVYIPIVAPFVEPSIVPTDVTLAIRALGDPLALASSVRNAIAGVNPNLSVGKVRTMDAIVLAARGKEAFVGVLLLFAATASLAATGLLRALLFGVAPRDPGVIAAMTLLLMLTAIAAALWAARRAEAIEPTVAIRSE